MDQGADANDSNASTSIENPISECMLGRPGKSRPENHRWKLLASILLAIIEAIARWSINHSVGFIMIIFCGALIQPELSLPRTGSVVHTGGNIYGEAVSIV